MITELELYNFQAHKKRKIELGPVTTIVGSSDVGKSAILRALRWLLLNKPAPTGLKRHGAKMVGAAMVVDDVRVVRKSDSAGNLYTSRHVDEEEAQQFKAFGRDVPEYLEDLFRVSDDNVQGQHDPTYWFTLTPGQLSKELNRIVALDKLDEVMSASASRVRKAKAEVEISETRVTNAKETEDSLRWVTKAVKDWDKVVEHINKQTEVQRKRSALEDLVQDITEWTDNVEGQGNTLDQMASELPEDEVAEYEEARKQTAKLENVISTVQRKRQECRQLLKTLSNKQKSWKQQVGNSCPLCGNTIPKTS